MVWYRSMKTKKLFLALALVVFSTVSTWSVLAQSSSEISNGSCSPECGEWPDCYSCPDPTCAEQWLCWEWPSCESCNKPTCAELWLCWVYPDCHDCRDRTCWEMWLCWAYPNCYDCGGGGWCCPPIWSCSSWIEAYATTCSTCTWTWANKVCINTPTFCSRCKDGPCPCPAVGSCTNWIEQYSLSCSDWSTKSCTRCAGTGGGSQCIPTTFATMPNFSNSSLFCSNSGTFILGTRVTSEWLTRFSGSCSKVSNGTPSVDTDSTRCSWQVTSAVTTHKISGTATDAQNKPLSGITVIAIESIGNSKTGGVQTKVTGADGKYSLDAASNRTYSVSAQNTEKYSFSSWSDIAITDKDVTKNFIAEIQPGKYKISGTVKDADGKPLSGIKISLHNSGWPIDSCLPVSHTCPDWTVLWRQNGPNCTFICPSTPVSQYSCVTSSVQHPLAVNGSGSDVNGVFYSDISKASLYKDWVLIKTETSSCTWTGTKTVFCGASDDPDFSYVYGTCDDYWMSCNQGICPSLLTPPFRDVGQQWNYDHRGSCSDSDGWINYFKKWTISTSTFELTFPGGSYANLRSTWSWLESNGCMFVDWYWYNNIYCGWEWITSTGSSDSCLDAFTLSEVSCNGSATYTCPNGCSDGACIKSGTSTASIQNTVSFLASLKSKLSPIKDLFASLNIFATSAFATDILNPWSTVYTDANGNYEFIWLYTGVYTVKPEDQKWFVTDYTFDSKVTEITGTDKILDFVSKSSFRSHAIFGTVTNGSNKELMPDVKVWLTIDGSRLSSITNAQGQYRFNDLKIGDYIIKPEENTAHIFTSKAIKIQETDEAVEVNFESSHVKLESHGIFGVVRDSAGKKIAGIQIDLKDVSLTGKNTTTDMEWTYRFQNLEQWEYFVEPVNKNGYTFYSQKATIENTDVELNFTSGVLPPGEYDIFGVVTDKNNTPLDDIQIELDNLGEKRYTRTLNGGQYRFENLGKGGYLVKPEDKDTHIFVLKWVNIEDADVELNFKSGELPPGEFAIFGTVADTVWTPIAGIDISLGHANDNFNMVTDSSGQYRFSSLPIGGYIIQAKSTEWYTFPTPESVYIINSDVQVNFTSVERLFTINGTVTKGNDIPLKGVLVYIEHDWEKDSTVTNEEGRYEFTSLEAGEYNLRPENTDKFIFPFWETINITDSDTQVNFIAITQWEEIPEEVITELLSRNGDVAEWLSSLNSWDINGVTWSGWAGTSTSTLSFDPIFTPNSLITLLNEGYIPLANSYSSIGLSLVSKYDTICGNGQVEPGETCDDGEKNGQIWFCSPDCLYIGEVRLVNYQTWETWLEANIIQTPGEIGGKIVQDAQKIGNAIEKRISQVKDSAKQLILNNTTPEMRKIAVKTAEYTAIGATSILWVTAAWLQVLLYQWQWMTYTVKAWDTLESLGSQFNMTGRALQTKNGLWNQEQLKPGAKIHVKNRHFLEKGYLDQLKTVLNDRHMWKFSDKITKMFAKK